MPPIDKIFVNVVNGKFVLFVIFFKRVEVVDKFCCKVVEAFWSKIDVKFNYVFVKFFIGIDFKESEAIFDITVVFKTEAFILFCFHFSVFDLPKSNTQIQKNNKIIIIHKK